MENFDWLDTLFVALGGLLGYYLRMLQQWLKTKISTLPPTDEK